MNEREPSPDSKPRAGKGHGGVRRIGGDAGFTLLEVLIAVAIMAVSLTSMLGSQLNSMQATRYARDITAVALLAEYQIVELEWSHRKEGWVSSDVEVDGDFSEQGWPDMKWMCTIHFIEMPEYNQLVESKEGIDEAEDGGDNIVDAGDQAFGALGMVWPMVKAAIENSIRKVDCTVSWKSGKIEQEYTLQTFWTDPAGLQQLPGAGGEFTEADDPSSDGEEAGAGGGSGGGGSGRPGGMAPPSKGGGTDQGGGLKGGN
ncbi:MAG: prepilin-type N-terminal cleavage/methylation domain-containing protein [Myxococcales bacterium]|nr:prepilin-type N-terminal cleavage/methylation domain-containing protein [Myxococcales bacterium]